MSIKKKVVWMGDADGQKHPPDNDVWEECHQIRPPPTLVGVS